MLTKETVGRRGIFLPLKSQRSYYLERSGIGPGGEPYPTPKVGMTMTLIMCEIILSGYLRKRTGTQKSREKNKNKKSPTVSGEASSFQ